MDHPSAGKAVHYPEAAVRNVYPYDLYRLGDQLLTAGYYGEAFLLASPLRRYEALTAMGYL